MTSYMPCGKHVHCYHHAPYWDQRLCCECHATRLREYYNRDHVLNLGAGGYKHDSMGSQIAREVFDDHPLSIEVTLKDPT